MTAPDLSAARDVGVLYTDHHSWLQQWLRARLGNACDAADLAHDTFLRVIERRRVAEINEPRAFLTTVARGILVNWYQRRALESAFLEALAALPEAEAPSPEQRYLILETLTQVDAMLDSLPPRARQAFLLSQLDGLKYDDIATRLGCSLISVKRYMKQAFLACLCLMD
ncbi:sigma-70 family RNA polymerase sigma factor [Herbaspirillum sp. alder98]|uniref:sigma-70 family RNA polymerase sigma factor n=1 Tax=Herbaspirillum sp. alder98 TaxID=2913096 RepID=UPI001CD860E5|nr:sigma-70 family RNA polymerase sigma factor [Herbaspirillum sp. alder98]MCA1323626.1 sigma-70 family RNA polymerase sigma factor [Herbaspirillum sp. alder98]